MVDGSFAATSVDLEESAVQPRDVQITAYAIDCLYRSAPATLMAIAVSVVAMPAVMWRQINHVVLGWWCVAMIVVMTTRYGVTQAYRRQRPEPSAARHWANYFAMTSLILGLAWGAAGILFFVPGSVGRQLFLYAWITALIAGSLSLTSFWPSAYYCFAVPAMLGCAVRVAAEGTIEYRILMIGMLLYTVVSAFGVHNQRRSAYEAIALRFENMDLVEQLRNQRDIAERANIAKSKFLAAASHDLRQPLHALGLFVAALGEPSSIHNQALLVRNINRSLAALESLFNALLDISKLDAGIIQPEIRDVSLMQLFDRLASEYELQARSKGLAWRYQASDAVVRTDVALLDTILRNLIGNAIRYTSRGEVSVVCASDETTVTIVVSDTGIGIPADQHQEVFREFVQLHNPGRDRTKGLGLGLAIVDRLTKLLDHSLEMRSTPGAGSAFCLGLARGNSLAATTALPMLSELSVCKGATLRVLLLEDELDIREAMAMLLDSWGHEVIMAKSEDEALAWLGPPPDAVIADYQLREERTGIDAILRLRSEWGKAIPAIVVTGDTAPERLRQIQESGFACLHKPVSPGKLRAFLRNLQRERSASSAA